MSHWATVAPINSAWRGPTFTVTGPIDIGWHVRLAPLPEWVKHPSITGLMSLVEREQYVGAATFALSVDYDAESDGSPDTLSGVSMSKQAAAVERLRRANLALWLARPSWAGFHMAISARENDGEWIHRRTDLAQTIRPFERDGDNGLSSDDFSLAKEISDAASKLSVKAAPWVAMLLLWRALTEVWWENRYLLLWVALEALFGSTNPIETTYRLTQRLAFFLAEDMTQVRGLYDRARAGYAARSKVVHGFRHLTLDKKKANDLLADSEWFMRAALCKILTDAGHRRAFVDERKRENFLDGLIFD